MISVSAASGAILYFLYFSQSLAEPNDIIAHDPYHEPPARHGRNDAYYSCLETFENSDIPEQFLESICGTLGDTIPILKTSAYCRMADSLLQRCYESTDGRDRRDERHYDNRPYDDRPYDRRQQDGYYNQEPYNNDNYYDPYDKQPNYETPYNQGPYNEAPYDGKPYEDNPRVRNS